MVKKPKQGEVILLDLSPVAGYEQGGTRPCVVVSNDEWIRVSNVFAVVPLTTHMKPFPFHIEVKPVGGKPSQALLQHVRSVDISQRTWKHLSYISRSEMKQISDTLRAMFGTR